MVIFRKNLDERLKKLSAEEKKDDLLTFEQLGVDMMMVDEAHFFKTALSLRSCGMWLVLQPQAVNAPLISAQMPVFTGNESGARRSICDRNANQ